MKLGASGVLVNSAASVFGAGTFNPAMLRPFIDTDGQAKVVVNGRKMATNAPAALQYDEWKDIDRTVLETFTQRLRAVADVMAAGLVHPLGSIGVTVSVWDKVSDMTGPNVDMSGITDGEEDLPRYELDQVPIPVVHKDFRVNIRHLEASRRFGEAIDVTASAIAARVVAEGNEDLLLNGDSSISVNGANLYGYTTHPNRNTVDMATKWDDNSMTGADIVEDVQSMLAAARADNRHGPFILYVPAGYEGLLDNDYNPATSDTRTIRERILQLAGIQDIRVVDRLADHNVLLVQLDRETVDWAQAQGVTTIQWDEKGGMQSRFKVLTIGAPRIKSDYDGRSGIVHLFEFD